jgi:hypothetical protein
MLGAARDPRLSYAALLRFEDGGLPVCCVYLAFSVAMAATASGNIALIVDGSRPECRLVDGEADGRDSEFLEPSTLNLFMASLKRLDIGSSYNVRIIIFREVSS